MSTAQPPARRLPPPVSGGTSDGRGVRLTALACVAVAAGMVGMAYAAVPLYDLLCRATGLGGTPMRRALPASTVLERTLAVRLDANVAPGLPWRLVAETPQVEIRIGETATVLYRVRNDGPAATSGVASTNVQPALAGAYFAKIECFCFTPQTLMPGESLELPVVFYIDPALAEDANVKDLESITLSYTFFAAKPGNATAAAP